MSLCDDDGRDPTVAARREARLSEVPTTGAVDVEWGIFLGPCTQVQGRGPCPRLGWRETPSLNTPSEPPPPPPKFRLVRDLCFLRCFC